MAEILYLIRHARPEYPDGVRCCMGRRVDLPPSELGLRQAELLRERLRSAEIGKVYASPLKRTMRTAEILSDDQIPVQVDEMWSEADGGDWDGMPLREIRRRYPLYFVDEPDEAHRTPPNGESDDSVLERAQTALDRIAFEAAEKVAVVTHAGIGRILLSNLTGRPMNDKRHVDFDYADYYVLRLKGGKWTVEEHWSNPIDGEI